MPKIAPYEQQTRTPSPSGYTVDTGAGEALHALGRSFEEISHNIALVQQQDAATEASSALATLRANTAQRFIDAQENAADDAADFTPSLLKGFDADTSEIVKNTRSKLAARTIRERSLELRSELQAKALVWEATTRSSYRLAQVADSADKLSYALEQDPDSWKAAGAEQLAAIDDMQLPPQQRLELQHRVDAALSEGAATGYESGILAPLLDDPRPYVIDDFHGVLEHQVRLLR